MVDRVQVTNPNPTLAVDIITTTWATPMFVSSSTIQPQLYRFNLDRIVSILYTFTGSSGLRMESDGIQRR